MLYQFNAPIGYTKNPYLASVLIAEPYAASPYTSRSCSPSPCPTSISYMPVESTAAATIPASKTLDKLPFEIRLRIANELLQVDCLQLIKVCKSLYLSTVQRLYQNIKVDKNYSQFSDEYDFHDFEKTDSEQYPSKQFSCTYIKTPYNLKKLLVHYPKIDHFSYFKDGADLAICLVKSFLCISLPESVNIYGDEFCSHLKMFLASLRNLTKLEWLDKGFEYNFLHYLPDLNRLHQLTINISCFSSSWFSIQASGKLCFPNLKDFEIINFQNNSALTVIINSSNFDFKSMSNLKISRLENRSNDSLQLLYPYDELVCNTQTVPFKELDIHTLDSILSHGCRKFDMLSSLLLHDLLIEPSEAVCFMESINLQALEVLELSYISEYQILKTSFTSTDDLKESFLLQIVDKLVNIKHLLIDYRESYRDSVPQFLNQLPKSSHLKSLDLTIRYNRSKLSSYESENQLYCEYAKAITAKKRWSTLTKLSIDLKEENMLCGDINISQPLPSIFYKRINWCHNLKSLRFSPSNVDTHHEIVEMITNLKELKHLDVFGKIAGGAPHLGLEMVHPTFYDEWFKVQHVAILYTKCNRNIKYVRVNKCVFENCGSEVTPRDGLNRWFNQIIRMGVY